MSKFFEILKEEGKQGGIEIAEPAIVKAHAILEKTAARVAVEGEGTEKIIAGVLGTILFAFKAAVEKIADLNDDGKIG